MGVKAEESRYDERIRRLICPGPIYTVEVTRLNHFAARRTRWLFFAVFLSSMLFSALYLAWNRGEGLLDFFYQRGTNLFGDFTNNLHYPTHDGGPYYDSYWATFPPFAYTLYYLVNVCFTRANRSIELVAYVLVTTLSAVSMLYAVRRVWETYSSSKNAGIQAFGLSLCLLLSGVSFYTIERGNSVFNVMILLLFVMYLRVAKEGWKRELALLLIAAAAGIKMYPALFGLLYLQEKRYREAGRLLIYGLLFFFVPFAWFGGLDGLRQFLSNQGSVHSLLRNDFLTSIPSVFRFFAAEMGGNMHVANAMGNVVGIMFGAVLLCCVFLTRKLWLQSLMFMSFMALVPGWSAEYMAWYMAVPCVLFLCDASQSSAVMDGCYAVLFGFIFILLPFGTGFSLHAPISWNMLACFAGMYFISFLAIGDVVSTFLRQLPKKRA